jgi:hypothetical protein
MQWYVTYRRWFALGAFFSLFSLVYFATGDLAWLGFTGFLGFLGFLSPGKPWHNPA